MPMNQDTVKWLLEGPAWLRYTVELQLLGKKPDPNQALDDPAILALRGRLKDNHAGLPALKAKRISYTQTGNAYWDLFFLADIGLTGIQLGLEKDIQAILASQSADSTYITEPAMLPAYYCISGILLSTLAKLGFREDPHIAAYLKTITGAQRYDGGWHCEKSRNRGAWEPESCPMDNLNILMLIGQYERFRADARFNGALDLLLTHWEQREHRLRLDGFGVGRRYMSMKYPAVDYGILRVLDVLSLFPYAVKSPGFASMLDFVHSKAKDSRYTPETATGSYPGFDFDQTYTPSRWLTFLVARIEQRAGLITL